MFFISNTRTDYAIVCSIGCLNVVWFIIYFERLWRCFLLLDAQNWCWIEFNEITRHIDEKNINHAAVQRSNLLVFWKNWNWLAVRRSENHASALHLLWNQNDRNLCLSNGYHIRTYSHTASFLRSTNLQIEIEKITPLFFCKKRKHFSLALGQSGVLFYKFYELFGWLFDEISNYL